MTVLFVTPYLRKKGQKPVGGGLEAYLLRVAGALKTLGHSVIILSLGTEDTHYYENGIEIFFVRYSPVNCLAGSLNLLCTRLTQSLTLNRKIAGLLRERAIDIIQFPQTYGAAIGYFEKTPAVLRLSSYAKQYFVDSYGKKELYVEAFMERASAKRCNAVFAPSNVVANAFSQDIHRGVTVIESPFWNDVLALSDNIYRDQLSGKKYVLFIGRLCIEKGVMEIREIIYDFFVKNTDYYFVCCGDDGRINGLSAIQSLRLASGEFKEQVIYLQTMPHDELYPVIQHADFVICPSRMENLSNACMEAMYFKRVVIGTNGTSYEQLIKDGISGLLCEPRNARDLLEKMNKAASLDEKRKSEIGENARKRIVRLAPEYTVKKLLRFYQYIIDNVYRQS